MFVVFRPLVTPQQVLASSASRMQGSKYIAAAGVAGAALMLLRRAMRSNLVTGRNRLKLLTPIPEDIEISQAVKLTPERGHVESKAVTAGQRGPGGWPKFGPPYFLSLIHI